MRVDTKWEENYESNQSDTNKTVAHSGLAHAAIFGILFGVDSKSSARYIDFYFWESATDDSIPIPSLFIVGLLEAGLIDQSPRFVADV